MWDLELCKIYPFKMHQKATLEAVNQQILHSEVVNGRLDFWERPEYCELKQDSNLKFPDTPEGYDL